MIKTITGSFEKARFEAELVPHRSIGKRGAIAAVATSGVLLGMATGVTAFLTQGKALPFITPFAFAIQMGLTWAFMMNARASCERQHLKMDEHGLTITHTRPDWPTPAYYDIPNPRLARIEETKVRGIDKLVLRLHAKQMNLGHFLPPAETKELQTNLKTALRNWTQDPNP